MAALLPNGKQQYFDNAGLPLVGGKLYTYLVGTTTPKATYADAAGLVPNANPIILDARGEAVVFWRGAYRVVLKDALDNTIYTVDGVTEVSTSYSTSSNGSVVVPTGTTAQRDNPANPGYFRYNVDLSCFEGYYTASWRSFVQSVNGTVVPAGGDVLLKSVGGVGIVGSGDVALKTVGGVSIMGAGDIPVQAPLVSGVNIKTVGGVSLVGAGNVPLSTLGYSARTSNTILGAADIGTMIEITANTFTQTFTAAATLGVGWDCYYKNSGTGNITLDPNGAELIDGLSSYIMYPGECRLIQCTGTAFVTTVLNAFEVAFIASGTFTKPPGYRTFDGEIWNGGNSGEKSAGTSAGGGGGGGCLPFSIRSSFFGASETITIGAGGIGPSVSAVGTFGGASSIGTILVAAVQTGGPTNGGSFMNAASSSITIGFEGQVNTGTPSNGRALYGGAASSVNGNGSSVWGGGAGGSISVSVPVVPGTSKFGGNGGAANVATSGADGVAPGGGGGGTLTGTKAGDGARGEIRIRGGI